MKAQLYSGMWIPLSWEVKGRMAEIFNIPRNGATHVVNNRIQNDGYTDIDLGKVNVEVLQKELNSEETDFFKLWNMMISKVESEIKPVSSPAKLEKKDIQVNITIEGDIVKVNQDNVTQAPSAFVVNEQKVEEKPTEPKKTNVKKIKQDSTPTA